MKRKKKEEKKRKEGMKKVLYGFDLEAFDAPR